MRKVIVLEYDVKNGNIRTQYDLSHLLRGDFAMILAELELFKQRMLDGYVNAVEDGDYDIEVNDGDEE